MAVYGCRGCGVMISLSMIPGGNPAVAETPSAWATTWKQCRACKGLWCQDCEDGPCPGCSGELWHPDEDARFQLMFPPVPPPPEAAADAAERTWQIELKIALDLGLPVLPDTRIHDGVPDLRNGDTAQRYLRWLGVFCWLSRAEGMIGRRVSVEVDTHIHGVSVCLDQGGTIIGVRDPYGPAAMRGSGRWRHPQGPDLTAHALRCAWEKKGLAMEAYVAEELDKLAALEVEVGGLRKQVERLAGPLGPLGTLEQRDADEAAWAATLRPNDARALSLLAHDEAELVAVRGLEAIGRLDLGALHTLIPGPGAAAALSALGAVGDATTVDLLVSLDVGDLRYRARIAWACALGDLGDRRAIAALQQARVNAGKKLKTEIDIALQSLEESARWN